MELFKIEDRHALAALVAAYEHAEKSVALTDSIDTSTFTFSDHNVEDISAAEGKLDQGAEELYDVLMSICANHPCSDWAANINGLGPAWAINMLMIYNASIIQTESDLFQLCLLDGFAKHFSRGSATSVLSQLAINDAVPLPALEQVCRQTCRSIGLLHHRLIGYSRITLDQAIEFLSENPCYVPMKDLAWAAMNSPDFSSGDDEIAVAYRDSLETQQRLNDIGDFKDLCQSKLAQGCKMTDAETELCESGILPPRLIRARARRFSMRLALGKFHRLLMEELDGITRDRVPAGEV